MSGTFRAPRSFSVPFWAAKTSQSSSVSIKIYLYRLVNTRNTQSNPTMTIKVEREALLRVLSRAPSASSSPCEAQIPDDGEFVLVDIPKPFYEDDCYVKNLPESTYDDDRSFCTLSTDSSSTDSSDCLERRVTFATPLVTDEWVRPWTPREEISNLFYSTEETQRWVLLTLSPLLSLLLAVLYARLPRRLSASRAYLCDDLFCASLTTTTICSPRASFPCLFLLSSGFVKSTA